MHRNKLQSSEILSIKNKQRLRMWAWNQYKYRLHHHLLTVLLQNWNFAHQLTNNRAQCNDLSWSRVKVKLDKNNKWTNRENGKLCNARFFKRFNRLLLTSAELSAMKWRCVEKSFTFFMYSQLAYVRWKGGQMVGELFWPLCCSFFNFFISDLNGKLQRLKGTKECWWWVLNEFYPCHEKGNNDLSQLLRISAAFCSRFSFVGHSIINQNDFFSVMKNVCGKV